MDGEKFQPEDPIADDASGSRWEPVEEEESGPAQAAPRQACNLCPCTFTTRRGLTYHLNWHRSRSQSEAKRSHDQMEKDGTEPAKFRLVPVLTESCARVEPRVANTTNNNNNTSNISSGMGGVVGPTHQQQQQRRSDEGEVTTRAQRTRDKNSDRRTILTNGSANPGQLNRILNNPDITLAKQNNAGGKLQATEIPENNVKNRNKGTSADSRNIFLAPSSMAPPTITTPISNNNSQLFMQPHPAVQKRLAYSRARRLTAINATAQNLLTSDPRLRMTIPPNCIVNGTFSQRPSPVEAPSSPPIIPPEHCYLCGIDFPSSITFHQHVNDEHENLGAPTPQRHRCRHCCRPFTDIKQWRRHEASCEYMLREGTTSPEVTPNNARVDPEMPMETSAEPEKKAEVAAEQKDRTDLDSNISKEKNFGLEKVVPEAEVSRCPQPDVVVVAREGASTRTDAENLAPEVVSQRTCAGTRSSKN